MKQQTTQSGMSTLRCIPEGSQKNYPNNDSIDFKADILLSQPELQIHKSELELPNDEIPYAYETASLIHDFRAPFNGFLGLSKIIAEEISTLESNEIRQKDKAMWNSAMPYKPELIHLLSFTEEVQATEVETAQKKGIDIEFDIPANIFVWADANMLRAILYNLYSNAIKFSPKGGKIKIAAKHAITNKIVFSIKDSGIGMSKEMLLGLFHLNKQINRKGTDVELNTGLGLFLCKYFIEKHRGAIWAESDEGKGSTFHFNLPCIPKAAPYIPT